MRAREKQIPISNHCPPGGVRFYDYILNAVRPALFTAQILTASPTKGIVCEALD